MRVILHIACCCMIFMSVKAYEARSRRRTAYDSGSKGCQNRTILHYHTYENVSLQSRGQPLETVTNAINIIHCMNMLKHWNETNFITAQYYPEDKECHIYSSATGIKNTVQRESVNTMLLVSGHDEPCSDRFSPCLPTQATCINKGIHDYQCQCQACSVWDVPEGMSGCPSFYLDFNGDQSSCSLTSHLTSHLTIEALHGQIGKSLHVGTGEFFKLGPVVEPCSANPVMCGHSFSVVFWMKNADNPNAQHQVIGVTNGTTNGENFAGFSYYVAWGFMYFSVYDSNRKILLTATGTTANEWNQYAFIYNNENIEGYRDGNEVTADPLSNTPTSVELPTETVVFLGKVSASGFLKGDFDFDELLVFSYPLEINGVLQ